MSKGQNCTIDVIMIAAICGMVDAGRRTLYAVNAVNVASRGIGRGFQVEGGQWSLKLTQSKAGRREGKMEAEEDEEQD